MIATLKILFKTNDTFDYLNDQYEDELVANCNLILITLGAISGFASFYNDLANINTNLVGLIIFGFLSVVVGASISFIIGRYILTYVLHGLGKLLKGTAELVDIRVIVAYSLIPLFFKFPIILYLGISDKLNGLVGFDYWIINTLYLSIWLWSLKIMIQGIMTFNNFGLVKSLITISPFWIIGVSSSVFILLYNH